MKTAMQELIEALDIEIKSRGMLPNWDMYLEKEKEQIIDAVNQKIFGDITFTGSDEVITKGENYYNQIYNK